jgi:hypothetical protein
MEQNSQKKWRLIRGVVAILGALLFLMIELPNTGSVETGTFHHIFAANTNKPITEWRIEIIPSAFFMVIAAGIIPLVFILSGLTRKKRVLEIVGWSLWGMLILLVVFG